jgi:hypothetical protein
MTVKELIILLESYPVDAQVILKTQDGLMNQHLEFDESAEDKVRKLILTVKKSE